MAPVAKTKKKKVKVSVCFRLKPDMVKQIETIAKRENRTMTNTVENLLIKALGNGK